MRYRPFGSTGVQVSALGFGAMRLHMDESGGVKKVREEEALAAIRRAFELGVNYIDSGYNYCAHQSEVIVGQAVRSWRGKVYISTKMPTWLTAGRGDARRFLEEQLRKLQVDFIDFYHLHGLSQERWQRQVLAFGVLDEMRRARAEGLFRHFSFSCHDTPENVMKIIDTGEFDTLLCQYNLLDRRNEPLMAYAKSKGMGVAVMGPVGGGRLSAPRAALQDFAPAFQRRTTPEIALRFVLSNPNVDVALSGMNSVPMVEQNAAVASDGLPLSDEERRQIEEASAQVRKLADVYCTGCKYCLPCPQEVNIPAIFEALIQHKVWNSPAAARDRYASIGRRRTPGKKADACVQCGECEKKCPQNIKIREQLKEAHELLGK
jgi:hypothetical protein